MGRAPHTETTSTLDAARGYAACGWSVIPVPRGEKGPRIQGWTALRLGEIDLAAHFANGENVGVILGSPSGGLLDVDLDCAEAIAAADFFLPATGAVFGRAGKPRSHRLYICEPSNTLARPRPEKFSAPNGATLVELRGDGQQTICPPSAHPSGETVAWDCNGPPAEISGAALHRAVCRVAAAALLARHWPAEGRRHDAALALAGTLLRAGFSAPNAEVFIRAVATAAGDAELRDRVRAVVETARRLGAGRPATGAPSLAQIVGDKVVARVREWLNLTELRVSPTSFDLATPPWPEPLAPEAFDGLAGEVVHAIEPYSEADPAAVLIQLLTAFGNIIGRGPFYRVEAHNHHTNLFALIVGATSKGRKGVSWSQVAELFRRIENGWTLRIHGGTGSGEGIIDTVGDPVLRDGTIAETGVEDKRLLVLETEFAQVLAVMQREASTVSEVLRRAWDGSVLQIMVRRCPIKATGAHVSFIGHVTKDELVRQLDKTEIANGLLNRYLVCCARRSKALPDGGGLPDDEAFALSKKLQVAIEFARQPRELRRDAEAAQLWREVYGELSEGKPGLLGAVIGRAEAQVLRLSILYGLLDLSALIRRDHLVAALALWNYCEASARYVFGDALGDPVADEILRALRATPAGLTRNDLRELFQRNKNSAEIGRAIGVLLGGGWIEVRNEQSGGRPAQRLLARATSYAVNAINAVSQVRLSLMALIAFTA